MSPKVLGSTNESELLSRHHRLMGVQTSQSPWVTAGDEEMQDVGEDLADGGGG